MAMPIQEEVALELLDRLAQIADLADNRAGQLFEHIGAFINLFAKAAAQT